MDIRYLADDGTEGAPRENSNARGHHDRRDELHAHRRRGGDEGLDDVDGVKDGRKLPSVVIAPRALNEDGVDGGNERENAGEAEGNERHASRHLLKARCRGRVLQLLRAPPKERRGARGLDDGARGARGDDGAAVDDGALAPHDELARAGEAAAVERDPTENDERVGGDDVADDDLDAVARDEIFNGRAEADSARVAEDAEDGGARRDVISVAEDG